MWYEREYPATRGAEGLARVGNAETDLADPVLHLFARHAPGTPDWISRAMVLTADLAETAPWTDVLVDWTAKGVTKLTALKRYCTARGIPSAQVMAIGDMPADVPMLEWAAVGVAVADGHPAAIAVADEVVAACDDDGAAEALERLVVRRR